MNYSDIQKVNAEISTVDLKGKAYAMVSERVTAFRKLFPNGFIETEIVEHDGTTVLMQTKVGYYEDGNKVILATGMAQEVRGKGMVNGTSYIENCETSSVGRALGMVGLGINGGGICSAEELTNAVLTRKQMKMEAELFDTESDPKLAIRKQAVLKLAEKKGFSEQTMKLAPFSYCDGRTWDALTMEDLILVEQKLKGMKDA